MRSWVKLGGVAGIAFSFVGIAFVAVSLFTDISRVAWIALDNVKGAIGFDFCALAGFLGGRIGRRWADAAAATARPNTPLAAERHGR